MKFPPVYTPNFDNMVLSKERVALESAELALNEFNTLKSSIVDKGYAVQSDVDAVEGLCPEDLDLELPSPDEVENNEALAYDKTVVALEGIGFVLAAAMFAALAALLWKVRTLFRDMMKKIFDDKKGSSSANTQQNIKAAEVTITGLKEVNDEISRLIVNDPAIVKKLMDEVRSSLQGKQINVLETQRLDDLVDSLYFAITKGKTSDLISSLVSVGGHGFKSNYSVFFHDYLEALNKRLEVGKNKATELAKLLHERTEFPATRFEFETADLDKAIKTLHIGFSPNGQSHFERASLIKTRVADSLNVKNVQLGLTSKDIFGISFDYNRLATVAESIFNDADDFGKTADLFDKIAKEQIEGASYRQEAARSMTDFINATTAMGTTISLVHNAYCGFTDMIKTSTGELVTAMARVVEIVESSSTIDAGDKKQLRRIFDEARQRYQDYAAGKSTIV